MTLQCKLNTTLINYHIVANLMKKLSSSLILILLLSFNTTLYADSKPISKQQAVDIATQAHPGRVLGVKRKSRTYQVKTLSESGKLHVINIDAKTGRIKSGKKSRK